MDFNTAYLTIYMPMMSSASSGEAAGSGYSSLSQIIASILLTSLYLGCVYFATSRMMFEVKWAYGQKNKRQEKKFYSIKMLIYFTIYVIMMCEIWMLFG